MYFVIKYVLFVFVFYVVFCVIMDAILKRFYKKCKRKNPSKCRNWQCKLYKECKGRSTK